QYRAVDVAMLLEEVVPGQRQVFHRVEAVRLVGAAHLAALEVVEQLGEHQLDFPDHDRVAVPPRLPRHEARVHAAPHDGYSAGPECVRDLVAAIHVARHRRDADEVGFEVEVDRLDVFVGEHDLVPLARNGTGDGGQTRERRVEGAIQVLGPGRQRISLGVDEMDDPVSHAAPSPAGVLQDLVDDGPAAPRPSGKPGKLAWANSCSAPAFRNRDFGPISSFKARAERTDYSKAREAAPLALVRVADLLP